MHIAPGEREHNLRKATHFIHQAADAGAQMVLLPEALPYGWTDPSAKEFAGEIPDGRDCSALRSAARERGIFVCSGMVERSGERLFNAAVLIEKDGKVILHHRKINELEFAHDLYAQGDRIAVHETECGRIGLMICADAFVPGHVISRSLALMGAQVILSPCAWAVPQEHDNLAKPYGRLWRDSYIPVAREFGVWIAGCSNVGPIKSGAWAGHRCIGNSLVISDRGEVAFCGRHGVEAEELRFVTITPSASRRATGRVPEVIPTAASD